VGFAASQRTHGAVTEPTARSGLVNNPIVP